MGCAACHLHSCVREVPLFRLLNEKEASTVEAMVHSVYYDKGSYVISEGDESDALFIVRSGLIKLTQSNVEGKQHVVRLLFPGDYFGQYALLHHRVSDVSAEVVEGGEICRLRRDDFVPLLRENGDLSFHFLMSLSKQLHEAEEQAGAMQILDVEKRLARLLLQLHGNKAEEHTALTNPVIQLPSAKKELAAMIGTTAESFSRKLSKLEGLNMIAVNKRKVVITDILALRQLAEIGA